MSEFSDESYPFGDYIPEEPNGMDFDVQSPADDPMAPPDFYPGQADGPHAYSDPTEVDLVLEEYEAAFTPPRVPERGITRPAYEQTKQELVTAVALQAAEHGIHLEPSTLLVGEHVLDEPERYEVRLVSAESAERVEITYYPARLRTEDNAPVVCSVRIKQPPHDVTGETEGVGYTVFEGTDGFRVEKRVFVVPPSCEPKKPSGDEEADRRQLLDEAQRLLDNADTMDANEKTARQFAMEWGLSVVSETEAQTLITKINDAQRRQ